jgi:hypothetical protein
MSNRPNQEAVEELWRQALWGYRQEGLRERLLDEWPGDRNVNERIAYEYPPTFQPGYVGPRYFASRVRIVLMGQNPGEGSDPASVEMNREYREGFEAFTRGERGFADLNRLIASHMLRWRVFNGKGIFRDSGAGWMSLLDDDVRPSIEDVGYINYFPFKTSANAGPLGNSPFQRQVSTRYVGRLLELLAPTVIGAMGAWCSSSVERELRRSARSEVIRVQHPSARRPQELQASWGSLSTYLRGLT